MSEATIPTGAVTTADLYRELIGMRTDVTKALTRQEIADKERADHEARIRALERFRYVLLGATVVVSAGVSAFGAWIASGIHHP